MLRDWIARKLGRNPRKPEMRQANNNDEEAGQLRDSGIDTSQLPHY